MGDNISNTGSVNNESDRNSASMSSSRNTSNGDQTSGQTSSNDYVYYCHQCETEVEKSLTAYECGSCNGGFIERIPRPENINLEDIYNRSRNSRISSTIHVEGVDGTGTNEAIPTNISNIQGLVRNMMVTLLNEGVFDFSSLSTQDYVINSTYFDNIITQLMSQFDGSPTPATEEEINAVPIISITQTNIDENSSCSICLDKFELNQIVKKLKCEHFFHSECIVAWLKQNATCPVCRKSINESADIRSSTPETADLNQPGPD